MAKYILREEALSHPFANGKYDHRNANIHFILGHESYEEWLETLPTFTEQDIVKSVLNKIRAEITELDNEVCQRFLIEDIDKEVHHTYQECLDIIDKYESKSEE